MSEVILHTIEVPYQWDHWIEVYGGDGEGWYEWRIVGPKAKVIRDTGKEGSASFPGRQYGNPQVALRDALMVATDMPDPFDQAMQRVEDDGPSP